MDARTAHALGIALGRWARANATTPSANDVVEVLIGPEVLIGMDTRESGPWLAMQVAGGLERAGVRTRFAGVITTPGVAYLTRTGPFAAGVMISASHNPYHDNGLKVISHQGYKLPDEVEAELERSMAAWIESGEPPVEKTLTIDRSLDNLYTDYLAETVSGSFPLTLVVDCANGAATEIAPGQLESGGPKVVLF
jgi:phosphoglucosamine mutase